jgi:hypothetical protein
MRGRTISHYGSPGPGLRASASESDVAFQAPAASNFSRPLRSYEQPPHSHRFHSEEEGNANASQKQNVNPNTTQRTALIPHNR